nr:immunoglobulin heavy chain junction region [Mus musculus]NSM05359.1 immunoglobulin heavy chain junction region [Mus musculus]NSM07075.1 immunoglobulin heavy chain junction region [Mus musculus]NSM07105.1 immunoglobulin heavy chain junction region [Mus musculus]NSM08921.1 immunoglobulin heavy chain junction region [Mus musculus]
CARSWPYYSNYGYFDVW